MTISTNDVSEAFIIGTAEVRVKPMLRALTVRIDGRVKFLFRWEINTPDDRHVGAWCASLDDCLLNLSGSYAGAEVVSTLMPQYRKELVEALRKQAGEWNGITDLEEGQR